MRTTRRSLALPPRAIARSVRGQSLVELALTLPLLMVLMAGVVDLAHAFSVAGILANAAREGARYGETNPTDVDSIKTRVLEEAAGAPLTLIVGEVTVATDSGTTSGNPIHVTVTHDLDLLLAQALGLPRPTISRQATMVIF